VLATIYIYTYIHIIYIYVYMYQEECVHAHFEAKKGEGVARVRIVPHADLERHHDGRVEQQQAADGEESCKAMGVMGCSAMSTGMSRHDSERVNGHGSTSQSRLPRYSLSLRHISETKRRMF
jgi:hypothetical protein